MDFEAQEVDGDPNHDAIQADLAAKKIEEKKQVEKKSRQKKAGRKEQVELRTWYILYNPDPDS